MVISTLYISNESYKLVKWWSTHGYGYIKVSSKSIRQDIMISDFFFFFWFNRVLTYGVRFW